MFFPNDYVEQPPSKCPEPGEKRIFLFFDVSFQLSSPATFNVLFRDDKNKEVCVRVSVCLCVCLCVSVCTVLLTSNLYISLHVCAWMCTVHTCMFKVLVTPM